MRTILGIIVVAALAFCGWWFVGAKMFRGGVEHWLAAQEASGRSAAVEGMTVSGFPLTFRATSGQVAIFDPKSGWGWQAPAAEVSMPAWWPLRVTVSLPERQVLETPAGQIDLNAAEAEGHVRLSTDLAPVAARAATGAVTASMAMGELTASGIRATSDRVSARSHHLTLQADGLALTSDIIDLDDGSLSMDATATLAERIDDLPDAVAVPIDEITLSSFDLRFGKMAVTGSGHILADARGFAAGDLTLRLENWPDALDTAVAAGVIPANRVDMLEGAFRMMAADGTLELPLILSGGEVRFGPLPLGPAPRLR
ncbi:DUF2125 domain-containing protein [Falsirhodobacter algicola]|uniref:DUF2125 domain-containing protein n=1 Tax=Falsirhodobacter algicola TaxID=2692330 RepID=A0A8J8MT53_9RHOB|nr:DUF2125 domain-containing protein [Falsirhodobacter algicola]QUS35778.1 DUF2125 domain-containing protein [Falsirhodobacter algicola]